MNNSNNVLDQATKLQNEFYSNHSKNTLFKSNQKVECATAVSNQMDVNHLIANTFYILPNTNSIFIDYLIFKTFINPTNYDAAINHVLKLCNDCIKIYGCYDVHLNLSTFTISSCHRYKDFIQTYSSRCLNCDGEQLADGSATEFGVKLNKMHIYNTPNVMSNIITILSPIIAVEIKPKIFLHNKNESHPLLIELFAQFIQK